MGISNLVKKPSWVASMGEVAQVFSDVDESLITFMVRLPCDLDKRYYCTVGTILRFLRLF